MNILQCKRIVVGLMLLVPLGSSAFAQTLTAAPFLPLADGNSWTYATVRNGFNVGNETEFISGTAILNGVAAYRIIYANGFAEWYTSDSNGIRLHQRFDASDSQTDTLTPAVVYAQGTGTVGQTFFSSGTVSVSGPGYSGTLTYSASSTIVGFESVTVPAGAFRALKVQGLLSYSGTVGGAAVSGSISQTNWAVEGVGPVKENESETENGVTKTRATQLFSTNIARTNPEPFAFTPQTGVPLNATRTSNAITVINTTAPAPISVTGGQYRIGAGAFTSVPGTVTNGQTVTLQATSSSAFNTTTNVTVTIGGVSGTFSVTTIPHPISASPPNLNFPNQSVGTTSGLQRVTFTNNGSTGGSVGLSGFSVAGDFLLGLTTCGSSLAVGASCSIEVHFAPAAAGVRVGQLSLVTNPAGAPPVGLVGNRNAGSFVDANGDGLDDIFWRDLGSGNLFLWQMQGAATWSPSVIGQVPLDWRVAGAGDFNANGTSDLLWRGPGGATVLWLMQGGSIVGGGNLPTVADPNWTVAGIGDFNGDGRADLLWRHGVSGDAAMWLMNGPTIVGGGAFAVPSAWRVVGTGDFNGDGRSDILWRHTTAGANAVWFMNGAVLVGGGNLFTVTDLNWRVVGTGDFDADGRTDILWRHALSGDNVVWLVNGLTVKSNTVLYRVADGAWQVEQVSDFDRDGRDDLLWRYLPTGTNVIWLMNATLPTAVVTGSTPPVNVVEP